MKILLAVILTFGTHLIGNAQTNVNVKEMVGFGCYAGGTQSKSVQKVSQLIDKSKFKSIIKLLDSNNNAEKYLAVIVLERLNGIGRISLSEEQKDKISEIYNSDEKVSVCSGCTYFDKLTLKTMLDEKNDMRISASYWLEYKFEKQ